MRSIISTRRARISIRGVVAAGALAAGAGSANAQFNYNDFNNVAGLSLVDSFRSGSSLILTPASVRVSGAAWYTQSKQFVSGGFDTTIRFRISDILGTGADGLAFVIQNTSTTAIGGNGGAIGYGDNQYFGGVGIANSLAVEFDSWDNQHNANDWNDLDSNHASIQSRGLLPNSPAQQYSLGAAHVPVNMSDGAVHTALISYIAGGVNGLMKIYVDDLTTPVVTANVNLDSLLSLDNGSAWVGLTSATGGATDVETHEVLSWQMSLTVPSPGALPVLGAAGLIAARRRRPRFVAV